MSDTTYDAWPSYAPDEILPGLYQGGTEDDGVIGCPKPAGHYDIAHQQFDVVVTLYADAQPAAWGVEELRFGFWDAELNEFFIRKAIRMARLAHARWHGGERVLIRCQAGVNRSGFIMALVLMLEGLSAERAIEHIRECRSPFVLSNQHFEHWLLTEAQDRLNLVSPSSNVA